MSSLTGNSQPFSQLFLLFKIVFRAFKEKEKDIHAFISQSKSVDDAKKLIQKEAVETGGVGSLYLFSYSIYPFRSNWLFITCT